MPEPDISPILADLRAAGLNVFGWFSGDPSDTIRLVLTIILGLLTMAALILALRRTTGPIPFMPGLAYRLLHPENFHDPHRRSCQGCGYPHPATAVKCRNEAHIDDSSYDLDGFGAFLCQETTRAWGLRALIGATIAATLWLHLPWLLYTICGAVVLWLVLPMLLCRSSLLVVFVLVLGSSLVATALWRYGVVTTWSAWLTAPMHLFATTAKAGPFAISLDSGMAPRGAFLLNGSCAIAAGLGLLLSIWSSLDDRDTFNGLFVVLALGLLIGALALYVLSLWQGLLALAHLYLLLLRVALAWTATVLVGRAMLRSLRWVYRHGPRRIIPRCPTLPTVPPWQRLGRSTGAQTPRRRRGLVASPVHAVQRTIFALVNAVMRMTIALVNFLIRDINIVINVVLSAANVILVLIADVLLYIGRCVIDFLFHSSLPTAYRLATGGLLIMLLAPLLLVATALLLTWVTNSAFLYVAGTDPSTLWWACAVFVVALAAAVGAAVLYVGHDVAQSVLSVAADYISLTILSYWISLDTYAAGALLLHAPTHFGPISRVLNIVVGVLFVAGLATQRIRVRSTP